MGIKQCGFAALFSIFASSTVAASADYVDPLQYSEALDFSAVEKRQIACPSDYFSCEDRGAAFAGTCCQNGQLCSLDAHNQAACCPTSATCTGVAPGVPTATASFVSNTFFAFPYIPTTFANTAACTSALSACSRNYEQCTSYLGGGGGGYGVTIAVPGGGGTTVAPTQATLPSATATSICSSLSSVGCFNLQGSDCANIVGGGNGGNRVPRPTAAACVAGVIAGVGLGIAGGHL